MKSGYALRNLYASLTPRERQVIALLVSGLLNNQVAGELGISDHREGTPRPGDAENDGRLSRRPMKMDARLQLAPATSFPTDTIVR